MNIIVCCKVVRDLDDVPAAEWSRAEDSTFEIDYTRKVWNFFDEAALETALCIKDETEGRGSSCDLTALTVVGSKERIDSFLIDLYAIQYGKIVKILCEENLRFHSFRIAQLLAGYICREQYDAVLMGSQAGPEDNAQTAALTAELLHMPFFNLVTDLYTEQNNFVCSSLVDGGTRTAKIHVPAVYAFANAKHTYLRMATLREKMKAKAMQITTVKIDESIESGRSRPPKQRKMYAARDNKVCVILDGDTAEEKASKLFWGCVKEQLNL